MLSPCVGNRIVLDSRDRLTRDVGINNGGITYIKIKRNPFLVKCHLLLLGYMTIVNLKDGDFSLSILLIILHILLPLVQHFFRTQKLPGRTSKLKKNHTGPFCIYNERGLLAYTLNVSLSFLPKL